MKKLFANNGAGSSTLSALMLTKKKRINIFTINIIAETEQKSFNKLNETEYFKTNLYKNLIFWDKFQTNLNTIINRNNINKIQYLNFSTKNSKEKSFFEDKNETSINQEKDYKKDFKQNSIKDKNKNIKNSEKFKYVMDKLGELGNNKFQKEEENILNSNQRENNSDAVSCKLTNKAVKKKSSFDLSENEKHNEDNNKNDSKDESESLIINNFTEKESKKIIPRSEIRKMVKDEDFITMKKVRGSGPGGQHLNKTSSAVFLKDSKTNIAIKVSNSRDSIVNEGIAKKRLLDKLDKFYNGKDSKLEKKNEKIRKQKCKAVKRSAGKHSNNYNKKD